MKHETTTAPTSGSLTTGDRKPSVAAHTPGPWTLDGRNVCGLAFDGIPRCIAAVSGGSPKAADANARLIAAAPDMLAALHAVMDEWRDGYGLRCEAQARAAIAKAEGRGSPDTTSQSNGR